MASNILALYLNFGRYLLISPFTLRPCKENGGYMLVRPSFMLKVLQAGVQVATFVVISVFDWSGTYTQSRLKIAVYCFFNIYAVSGLLKLWFHGNKFERIVNSVLGVEQNMISAGIQLATTKYVRRSVLFGMAFVIIQMFVYYNKLYLGFYEGFKMYFFAGHSLLYGPTNCTSFGPSRIDGCQASTEIVFAGLVIWISASVTLLYIYYLNFLCFSHAAVLLGLARALLKQMHLSDGPNNIATYVKVANAMLRLSAVMGDVIAAIVFFWCFSLIPYYSFGMQSVINGSDYGKTIRSLIDWSAFFITLATAAEANATMKRVGTQILARLSTGPGGEIDYELGRPIVSKLDREDATILFHRTSANEYGLHGLAFTVTYSLVGSIAGLVATYTIIIYQLR